MPNKVWGKWTVTVGFPTERELIIAFRLSNVKCSLFSFISVIQIEPKGRGGWWEMDWRSSWSAILTSSSALSSTAMSSATSPNPASTSPLSTRWPTSSPSPPGCWWVNSEDIHLLSKPSVLEAGSSLGIFNQNFSLFHHLWIHSCDFVWIISTHIEYFESWHQKWFALLTQYNVVYFFSPIMTELAHYDEAVFSDSFTSCPRAGFITLWCRISWQLLLIRWCWCHLFFDMFSVSAAPNRLLQCLQVITNNDRAKRQVTKYISLAFLWLNSHLLLLKESFLFLES